MSVPTIVVPHVHTTETFSTESRFDTSGKLSGGRKTKGLWGGGPMDSLLPLWSLVVYLVSYLRPVSTSQYENKN